MHPMSQGQMDPSSLWAFPRPPRATRGGDSADLGETVCDCRRASAMHGVVLGHRAKHTGCFSRSLQNIPWLRIPRTGGKAPAGSLHHPGTGGKAFKELLRVPRNQPDLYPSFHPTQQGPRHTH